MRLPLQFLLLLLALRVASSARVPKPCPDVLKSLQSSRDFKDSQLFAALLASSSSSSSSSSTSSAATAASAKSSADGQCNESISCPDQYAPVCAAGADGQERTFPNSCAAGRCGAAVKCSGQCPCGSSPPAQDCPPIDDPVCGADGQQYANPCLAQNAGTAVACEGACPCAPSCPNTQAPVCDVNGVTQQNLCMAQAAGVAVACNGACPCPNPLSTLQQSGTVLLVPTDPLLSASLSKAGVMAKAASSNAAQLKGELAKYFVFQALQADKAGSSATSEAGHRLLFLTKGSTGKPSVVDVDARVEYGISRKISLCSKVTVMKLSWAKDVTSNFWEKPS